ncbi:hypothetical protein [Alkaliphilus serpentinus]|uniref:GGDEF domain-containing protein n=1 Tax=Alkaliphilus serpentinus TaxID=1482731 RepID=A0A833HPM3_9FIRM|nr:hypothetical protein [Alkaliphilus serpentinus]KAB3531070.1 hypothetical protein F8153_05385 [Alkaliphilus serpentinus]
MRRRQLLTLLQGGQLIVFYITISYILQSMVPFFIFQYMALMLIFIFVKSIKGFVLLIAYTFVMGTGYLLLGFIKSYGILLQGEAIIFHLAFIINASLIYTTTYIAKGLEEENLILRKKVDELEDYVGPSNLLTKQEFENRSSLIRSAMARRGEEGYQIIISVEKMSPYIQKSTFNTLTNIALEVFRSQYDLVGKWDDDTFILLLQNTDEEGMRIALNRYLSKIKLKMDLEEENLIIKTQEIGSKDKGMAI